MKTLYFIGGTMGVGKTTVCRTLQKKLPAAVFLDGDWCWEADPFQVTEETKTMVLDNIRFLLNQFLHCSAYENVIFCWVMHEESIMDDILSGLDLSDCRLKSISLVCSEEALIKRLSADVEKGIREADIIARSVPRLPLYAMLSTVKLDTTDKSVWEIAEEIMNT